MSQGITFHSLDKPNKLTEHTSIISESSSEAYMKRNFSLIRIDFYRGTLYQKSVAYFVSQFNSVLND